MPSPLFFRIGAHSCSAAHESLRALQAEYLFWVHSEMARCFRALALVGPGRLQVEDEVGRALAQDRPPGSVFYLIEVNGEAAGMCGLRSLGADTAEIKRLYIRPAFRGMQLGSRALRRLLGDAGRGGYTRVCLDSAPFMTLAHGLYKAHGFTDCAAYEGSEVPAALRGQWRFMQRALDRAAP